VARWDRTGSKPSQVGLPSVTNAYGRTSTGQTPWTARSDSAGSEHRQEGYRHWLDRTTARPRDSSRGEIGPSRLQVQAGRLPSLTRLLPKKNKIKKIKKITSFLVSCFLTRPAPSPEWAGSKHRRVGRQATDRSVEKARHVHGTAAVDSEVRLGRLRAPAGRLPTLARPYDSTPTGQQPWRDRTEPAASPAR